MNKKPQKLSNWISGEGPESDIVISSRVRVARNIEKIPYPNQANDEDLKKIIDLVKSSAEKIEEFDLDFINMNELDNIEKESLVEKHLISPPHAHNNFERALLLNKNEDLSIMVNEEDHLRIQVLVPGLQLDKALDRADKVDDLFENDIDFAFSKKWGYLSACPTNVGTGLRSSVMIHLPALNITNNIEKMLGAVSQLGLAVRGIYGEGSESSGNIYQISNQITLGQSEKDIIDNLKSVTLQIIEQERQARERLLKENKNFVLDKIKRAYGILKYAHRISNKEALELISYLRLGVDLNIIENIEFATLGKLMVLIRPAHLQKYVGENLSAEKRDVKRAELIQNALNK